MTNPIFSADQATEIAKQAVLAASKTAVKVDQQAAATSTVASSIFSNFGPYGVFYSCALGAIVGFIGSRKPAEGETRTQCAAKDFFEIFSKKWPLVGATVVCAALHWPIISAIAPHLDGTWLKAGSQHVANSKWPLSKMAVALVSSLTTIGAFLAAANSMRGLSSTGKLNTKLAEQETALKTLITNWETHEDTTLTTKEDAAKDRVADRARKQELAQLAAMPLEQRIERMQRLYRNALKDTQRDNKALRAQSTQPTHKSKPPKLLEIKGPGSGSESEEGTRLMTEAEIKGFFNLSEKEQRTLFANLPEENRKQISDENAERRARKSKKH